jgi:hypothetical protein
MNLTMGSHRFVDVTIPVLWGERAILADEQGAISVVDLGSGAAQLEVLGDQPAPGIEFRPEADGFTIRSSSIDLYTYTRPTRTLSPISLDLPEIQVSGAEIRVGSNRFVGNVIAGSGVGLVVAAQSIAMGAPLPPRLAELVV